MFSSLFCGLNNYWKSLKQLTSDNMPLEAYINQHT